MAKISKSIFSLTHILPQRLKVYFVSLFSCFSCFSCFLCFFVCFVFCFFCFLFSASCSFFVPLAFRVVGALGVCAWRPK